MLHLNKKTGASFESPCTISGGDWVVVEDAGFESLSVKELKALAEEKQINLTGATKKADIIEAIVAAEETPEDEDASDE